MKEGQLEVKWNRQKACMEAYITYPLGSKPKLISTLADQPDKQVSLAWRAFLKEYLRLYVERIGGSNIKFGDVQWSDERKVVQDGQHKHGEEKERPS